MSAITECTGGKQIPFYIEMTWKNKTNLDKFIDCQDDSFIEIFFMIYLVQLSENNKIYKHIIKERKVIINQNQQLLNYPHFLHERLL